jgi:threonine aldolase
MVHMVQPKLLSLTQATERGSCYSLAELRALTDIAHDAGLAVHMDGARFANALVALNASPAEMSWQAGVDVLSFGATKNGGMACEAVLFLKPGLVADFEYRRKRGGHLGCKSRYTAAQWLAYLKDNVWQRNASHANAMAAQIADGAGALLTVPAQTNQIFLQLGHARMAALRAAGFLFYDWGDTDSGEARFVTSWQSKPEDVAQLCAALKDLI